MEYKTKDPFPFCNRGGVNKELLDRIALLENEVSILKQKKASKTEYGMAQISDATDITTDVGFVLGAKEKNAAIPGSIMHSLKKAENNALWKHRAFNEDSNVKEASGKRIVTYSLDLSGCNELCMNIYAKTYSPMFYKVFPLCMNGMIDSLYLVDNRGYTWSGHVSVSINEGKIMLHTYKNSTNIDVNYFELVNAWTR